MRDRSVCSAWGHHMSQVKETKPWTTLSRHRHCCRRDTLVDAGGGCHQCLQGVQTALAVPYHHRLLARLRVRVLDQGLNRQSEFRGGFGVKGSGPRASDSGAGESTAQGIQAGGQNLRPEHSLRRYPRLLISPPPLLSWPAWPPAPSSEKSLPSPQSTPGTSST